MTVSKPFHASLTAARSFISATHAMRGTLPSATSAGTFGSFGMVPFRSRTNADSLPRALASLREEAHTSFTIGTASFSAIVAFSCSSGGTIVLPNFSYQPHRIPAPSSMRLASFPSFAELLRPSAKRKTVFVKSDAKASGFAVSNCVWRPPPNSSARMPESQ